MTKNEEEIIKIIKKAKNNRLFRIHLTRNSHFWFFLIYLNHYIKYPTAPFQKEIFAITENEEIKTAIIAAFRGSAKSTIISTSYPIWSILGKQEKKFILLLSQTQNQARQHMANLKEELETNQLLRSDLGPFKMPDDEWRASSIVLPKYNSRITAVSSEQSIRGLRHKHYRPDLIICDDIEDLESVKTQEGRNKIYQWLTGDVIPAGDNDTRLIIVGTILHEDSLIRRLQKKIDKGFFDGIYKEYPITNGKNQPLWPGKFPDKESIKRERRKAISRIAWQREYYFKIINDSQRVVWPEWIKYYKKSPKSTSKFPFRYTVTGIDLAISEKTSADYTAMVSGKIYGYGNKIRIYILPHPINKRLNSPDTIKTAKKLSIRLGNGKRTRLLIESNGYQKSLVQQLRSKNFPAEEVMNYGRDKEERLRTIAPYVENGAILFPEEGVETLINQLIGFKTEKHDDLADAFAILVGEIMKNNKRSGHLSDIDIDNKTKPITAGLMDKRF